MDNGPTIMYAYARFTTFDSNTTYLITLAPKFIDEKSDK